MPQKRIAVIDRELCNPKVADYLCKRVCPVNRSGDECVVVSEEDGKPLINEGLCVTCGICVKKCPKQAIKVINLPARLDEDPIHRYGPNLFSLYRLPVPKRRSVVGLIGPNGTGKSTVLSLLSGQSRPNCGLARAPPWGEIISRFRGTELQEYLGHLAGGSMTTAYKPQKVDAIPRMFKGKVSEFLEKTGPAGFGETVKRLGMENMVQRSLSDLSGGELQLVAVAATLLKDRDFYFFDEPSSYLDVFSRLVVANEIRRLAERKVVMLVEHDLALLDYLTDYVHILYGEPGVFGIVSPPYGVRVGINNFLDGYIREDNVRFRKDGIVFSRSARRPGRPSLFMQLPPFRKSFESFRLETAAGNLCKGEVIGILGPNAIGKSTFIRMLAGEIRPDSGKPETMELSYKPQRVMLSEEEKGLSAQELMAEKSGGSISKFKGMVSFLGLDKLLEHGAGTLSGGELQSCFIAAALAKRSDLVLMDEPSAFLDVEQRLRVAKLIRQQAEEREKPFFVVDHDLLFIDAISDRLMLFSGKPGVSGRAAAPVPMEQGMNSFLKALGITYRRDPQTGRPRINKPGSQKDREQKSKGRYYYA
jgi:ATP-binding cassette subfamily E protein 1